MVAAHIILGIFCGLLAAGYVWLAFGVPLLGMLLAYWVAGTAACLVSVGVAIVVAAICPRRQAPPPDC